MKNIKWLLLASVVIFSFLFSHPAESDIVLKALVANPSKTKTQSAVLKAYLPKEVKPEDIVDMEDLKIDYDVDKAVYYVYQVYDLKPGQTVTRKVTISDIWVIPQNTLDQANVKSKEMTQALQGTTYAVEALAMQQDIERKALKIYNRQEEARDALPQTHIAAYRNNMELLDSISTMLAELDKMVFENRAAAGVVVEKVSVRASWWVILGVIVALAVLSFIFFLIWHGQAVRQKIMEEAKEEEELPPLPPMPGEKEEGPR